MTDVLNVTHDALDDLTSKAESKPKAAEKAPISSGCHFCAQTFEGPTRFFQRGTHEKKAHHDQWLAAKAGVKPKKATAKKATTAKKPPAKAAPSGRRIPAAESLTKNIARGARMFASVNPPMGRALAFSAPATGQAIDDVVAGTYVDRKVIQRFAGAADKWDRLGGVLSFPILFGIVATKPEFFPLLEADLREATIDVIIASLPTLEKQKQREDKAVAALVRLGEVDERYAKTDDPVGLMLRDLLYGFDTGTAAADGEAQ